jgi:nucleotide-binding universal stress UspA family protein
MYNRMLVPLDGSELAETVCVYAKELAGRLDIDVVLLHVSRPASQGVLPMERAYIDHVAENVNSQIQDVQKKTSQGNNKPVKVTGELIMGHSAEEILNFAEKNSIDLVVLGSHGRSGIQRWTIGSIAGKVMGATNIPIWLIKPGAPEEAPYDKWPRRTFIVPLDGSELAESVLPHLQELVKQRGTEPIEVILLRVSEPLNIPTYYSPDMSGVSLDWGNFIQQDAIKRKQAAKDYLTEIENRIKSDRFSIKSVVIEGKPNDEIVDYANKQPYSIIIMATHGRSGFSRMVYGSAAANILHGVSRPMFIIKPQSHENTRK